MALDFNSNAPRLDKSSVHQTKLAADESFTLALVPTARPGQSPQTPVGGPNLVAPRAPAAQPAPAGGSSGAASGAGKPVVGANSAPVVDRATGLVLPRVDAASLDPKGVEHAVWHLGSLLRDQFSKAPKSEPFGIPLQEFKRFESLSAKAAAGEASPARCSS